MIPESWNLKDINNKIKKETFKLAPEVWVNINNFINKYPKFDGKLGAFIGNIYRGNLIYNHIVNELLTKQKITTACTRYSFQGGDISIEFSYDCELILVDNLQFSLMTPRDKQICVNFIDDILNQVNFVFLNVSRENEINSMPHALEDFLEISNYLFKVL